MVKIALAVFLIAHGLVHTGLGVRTSRGFQTRGRLDRKLRWIGQIIQLREDNLIAGMG